MTGHLSGQINFAFCWSVSSWWYSALCPQWLSQIKRCVPALGPNTQLQKCKPQPLAEPIPCLCHAIPRVLILFYLVKLCIHFVVLWLFCNTCLFTVLQMWSAVSQYPTQLFILSCWNHAVQEKQFWCFKYIGNVPLLWAKTYFLLEMLCQYLLVLQFLWKKPHITGPIYLLRKMDRTSFHLLCKII